MEELPSVEAAPTSPTSVEYKPLRQDQVASGVTFLSHPNVKSTPLSQRLAFLEQKGLTPTEIEAALKEASVLGSTGEVRSPHLSHHNPPAGTSDSNGSGSAPFGFTRVGAVAMVA
eukprot:CAMPEP_0171791320 /NCGR_PEP_ID=MMETSP0991-20121206/66252_1 /TAXON_ID=483369 /ORGANISM="non described non described, Strain CCMP2098" /LENGTH=114 /DNA_ID=CAMNT_0012401093 /DNA_START=50 /DNA_END=390 /DNA_ORIENTATION=+